MKVLKRIFCGVIACFVAVFGSLVGLCDENQPKSVTILGDSIASGYGLENYSVEDKSKCESYGNLLKKYFEISDENYSNFALDGQTSDELYKNLLNGNYDDSLKNDLVIISIGGNDLLSVILGENSPLFEKTQIDKFLSGEMGLMQALQGADLIGIVKEISVKSDEKVSEFSQNIPLIIDYVKSENPHAQIVLQNLYNPMNTGVEAIDTVYATSISKLNNAISQVDGVVICDVFSSFAQSEASLIQRDFTHPNSDGHKLIFETMKTTVAENCNFSYEKQAISDNVSNKNLQKNKLLLILSVLIIVTILVVGYVFNVKKRKKRS